MDHDLINKTIDGCGCFLLPLTGIKRVGGRGKRTQPWSQCARARSRRCKPASAAAYNAHAGTRRHGKTTCRRQYKARRDETRRDETGRGGTRQDKLDICVAPVRRDAALQLVRRPPLRRPRLYRHRPRLLARGPRRNGGRYPAAPKRKLPVTRLIN